MAEVSTIARPYAKAAFEFALANGQLSQWSQALATAALVAADQEMKRLLDSPALSDEQKAALLVDVCGDGLTDAAKNFIGVLADNKRLPALPAISRTFEVLKAQQEQALDVDVISAFELTQEQQSKLAQKLKAKWQKEISINTRIDTGLIGGVVIRAGDLVIDDSLRGRLTKIAEAVGV